MAISNRMKGLIHETANERIVEIIQHYLGKHGLRPRHNSPHEFVGLCPFHDEKSPSFTVTTKSTEGKAFYHCFGCGGHRNAVGFVMEYCRLEPFDALCETARLVGIPLKLGPTDTKRARRRSRGKKRTSVPRPRRAIPPKPGRPLTCEERQDRQRKELDALIAHSSSFDCEREDLDDDIPF